MSRSEILQSLDQSLKELFKGDTLSPPRGLTVPIKVSKHRPRTSTFQIQALEGSEPGEALRPRLSLHNGDYAQRTLWLPRYPAGAALCPPSLRSIVERETTLTV